MSKQIGIIGAGTAGLHLGLYLRQHGVGATIITDRAPEAYVGARLPKYGRASCSDNRTGEGARRGSLAG